MNTPSRGKNAFSRRRAPSGQKSKKFWHQQESTRKGNIVMSSIHVGTICFDWYPFEPRVLRLVQAAVDAHYSVDVICLHQPHEKYYQTEEGVHIYRMPMNERFGHSLPLTVLSWCWLLLLAMVTVTFLHLKRPYDVIHVHNMPDFLVFATVIPKLLGAKIILDVQDVSPELMGAKVKGRKRKLAIWLAIWQERLSTRFADHVITVGWPFEEKLLSRGVPREKLSIIINSADPKLFPASRQCPSPADAAVEGQPFIVMYHGTVVERSGIDTAIRALALARKVVPNVRLDIQGRDEHLELLPSLTRLAAELGVSEHVVFSRSCPPSKLVDFVTHGDVGIIPYRRDDFMELLLPTKAYEWAWMHRAMIASDMPGIRSMFRPESIILCDPQSPASFAQAIIDLYQHPEKRSQMVASALEDYAPFRWEPMAKRYQQLLLSLSHKQQQDPIGHKEEDITSDVTPKEVSVGLHMR
jgi:glycosyltransferase involved in cell wall biosynthesis